MTLTDFVERVGRTIFEAPFGGGTPRAASNAELAEIRHAILAEIDSIEKARAVVRRGTRRPGSVPTNGGRA